MNAMNEIFETTELLNFDYNQNKKRSIAERLISISAAAAFIFSILPLLPL